MPIKINYKIIIRLKVKTKTRHFRIVRIYSGILPLQLLSYRSSPPVRRRIVSGKLVREHVIIL